MKAIFDLVPDARVKTAVADYVGKKNFYEKFEATGRTNIGSMVEPMEFRDACNCEDYNEV
jgi:hypothetical protein